jgi:hypothetical protein
MYITSVCSRWKWQIGQRRHRQAVPRLLSFTARASLSENGSSRRHKDNRRFFDKMMKSNDVTFNAAQHGAKFLAAMLEFDNPVDLLIRMTDPQVCTF